MTHFKYTGNSDVPKNIARRLRGRDEGRGRIVLVNGTSIARTYCTYFSADIRLAVYLMFGIGITAFVGNTIDISITIVVSSRSIVIHAITDGTIHFIYDVIIGDICRIFITIFIIVGRTTVISWTFLNIIISVAVEIIRGTIISNLALMTAQHILQLDSLISRMLVNNKNNAFTHHQQIFQIHLADDSTIQEHFFLQCHGC